MESKNDLLLKKLWMKEAKKIRNANDLATFITKLNEFEHDYGTIVYAMSAVMVAAFNVMNKGKQGGITSYQASNIGREMINEFFSFQKDAPMRILAYENLLYPQYENKFTSIPVSVFEWAKKQAKQNLDNSKEVTEDVIEHWESIANGRPPFDLKVIEEFKSYRKI